MISELIDRGFRPVDKDKRINRGWYNEIGYDEAQKHAVIVLYPSVGGGDYALNVKCMLDHIQAIQSGYLEEVTVCLLKRTPLGLELHSEFTLNEVAERLEGRLPLNGNHGAFHWIDEQGRPATPGHSNIPFPDKF